MRKANAITGTIKVLSFLVAMTIATSAANKQLEETLKGKYEVTKTGIDRLRITKPGTVLVIQKDGIYANPSTDFGSLTTKVVDGNVIEPKGFSAAFFSNQKDRSLK